MQNPKFAIAQMAASENLEANLVKMKKLAQEAKAQGADIVVFPEMSYFIGGKKENEAIAHRYSDLEKHFGDCARELQIYLIPGSLREPDPVGGSRYYNTLPVLDPRGKCLARYRKIFLFKANLPDRAYDEEKTCIGGTEATVVDLPWGKTGLSICYDLRFPELFRHQRERGCVVQILPSAFTVPTGENHWDPLTRARAIENQVFFIAPGLEGKCGDGRVSYGHSRIISPWGEILAQMTTGEGVRTATLEMSEIQSAQNRVNSWASRKPSLF